MRKKGAFFNNCGSEGANGLKDEERESFGHCFGI